MNRALFIVASALQPDVAFGAKVSPGFAVTLTGISRDAYPFT